MLIQLFGSFIRIMLTTLGFTCIPIHHFAEFFCQLFPPLTDIVTADETAIQPGDYTQVASTPLTWAAGARTQTETVNVVTQSDNGIEGVEYFTATISTLTGGNAAHLKSFINPLYQFRRIVPLVLMDTRLGIIQYQASMYKIGVYINTFIVIYAT